jgi:hypothetical protein
MVLMMVPEMHNFFFYPEHKMNDTPPAILLMATDVENVVESCPGVSVWLAGDSRI